MTGSKSIIRNNVGLCKQFDITFFRTFGNIVIDPYIPMPK